MKQQKKTTKQNGITLISLVITIVVMLILAGVAISIAVDPEGLFRQAEKAKTDWDAQIAEEQSEFDEALGYLGIEPATQISDEMPAGKGWDNSETGPIDKVAIQSGKTAPIPKGYTVSQVPGESSIKGGMVVYQIPAGATVDWANNEITLSGADTPVNLQENVNQYVWIPVDDINNMVMCKKNNIEQGNYEENGKPVTTKICKLEYDVERNEIICKTHGFDTTGYDTTANVLAKTNLDTVGLAGRVYEVPSTSSPTKKETTEDNKNIYTLTPSFKKNTTFSANLGYREPAIVTGNTSGTGNSYDGEDSNLTGIEVPSDAEEGTTVQDVFKAQLNKDFIEMAKSVAKYGGFYISRFEPSYDSENEIVISKKNKAVLTSYISTSGNRIAGDKWYGLYNKTLNSVEKDESVNSHMIWGCQYDQVIEFLGDKAEVGHLYRTTKQEKTGYDYETNGTKYVDQDILNNIYDLEGNNYEWTAQADSTSYRVYRGSSYYAANNSSFSPASYLYSDYPTVTYTLHYTARPTLYVK